MKTPRDPDLAWWHGYVCAILVVGISLAIVTIARVLFP